jgi:streptogramin lyase
MAFLRGNVLISAPNQAASYVHYDGRWMSGATVSVSASSSQVNITGNAVMTTQAAAIQYSSGLNAGASLHEIVTGPDGNMWFGESTTDYLASCTMSGTITEYPSVGTVGEGLLGIAFGPDGNLWYVTSSVARIGKFTI